MAIDCYLHVSLFCRTPTNLPLSPAPALEPALWMIVQPYVPLVGLADWIRLVSQNRDDTSAVVTHKFLDDLKLFDSEKLKPVILPPDVSLVLARIDAGGNTVGQVLLNDRSGVELSDVAGFERDNMNPEKIGGSVKKPLAGPYSAGFVAQLADLLDHQQNTDSLVDWLTMSFAVSTTRRLRPSTVRRQDAVHLFEVAPRLIPQELNPGTGEPIRTVSMLSMCGHMLRLDAGIGFDGMRAIDSVALSLRRNPGSIRPTEPIPLNGDEAHYLRALFQDVDLAAKPLPDPPQRWTASFDPEIARRVYVLPHRTGLVPRKLRFDTAGGGERTLFLRSDDKAGRGGSPMLMSEIEDLGIYVSEGGPPPSGPPSIDARFHETLRARLLPYRSATTAGAARPRGLWQLAPEPEDRERFVALFTGQAHTEPTRWPASWTIHGPDGGRIVRSNRALESCFVGNHLLPWDDVKMMDPATMQPRSGHSLPTVLFWFEDLSPGQVPVGPGQSTALEVTLVLPLPVAAVPLAYRPFDAPGGSTGGALWCWTPSALPPLVWNAIELMADRELVRVAVPAVSRSGDFIVQPAQSGQNLEGVVKVDYPHLGEVTANVSYEVNRELVGYRKLNQYYRDRRPGGAAGDLTPLNPWSNQPPVFAPETGEHFHTFHYRHQIHFYAPDGASAPRSFYHDRYSYFGGTRETTLDLEHTTGHAFELVRTTSRITHDVPPLLPNGLRREAASDAIDAFFSIQFLPAGGGKPERACITIDTTYLSGLAPLARASGGQTKAGKDADLTTKAWRAIAELAHANEVFLRCRFRRFDFAGAVRAAQAAPGAFDMNEALLPVPDWESGQPSWPIPRLQDTAMRWLSGTAPGGAPLCFEVELEHPNAKPIAQSCHVVEFWIELTRPANALPELADRHFVRPWAGSISGADAYDEHGEKFEPVTDPAALAHVQKLYGDYVVQLSGVFDPSAAGGNSWRSLCPVPDPNSPVHRLRELIGSGLRKSDAQAAGKGRDGGDWIVPGPIAEADEQIVAAFAPLTFRPLGKKYKGIASHAALARYARAVKMLVDAEPGAWSERFEVADWREWYARLATRTANVASLAQSALGLIVPAYQIGGQESLLDKEAVALLKNWLARSGGFGGRDRALAELVMVNPALFADARALLLTALNASDRLPRNLVRLQSEREIDIDRETKPDHEARRAERSALHVSDTMLGDAGEKALTFMEVLGSEKYDADFSIVKLQADGIEGLLRPPEPGTQPLAVEGPHVPAPNSDVIQLPSREPLVDAVHVYTAQVRGTEQADWWRPFASLAGAGLDAKHLVDMSAIRPAPGTSGYFLRYASKDDFVRSPQRDRAVVSLLFYVTSDEANQFTNDAFRFSREPLPAAGASAASAVDNDSLRLFKALSGTADLTRVDILPLALETATAQFAASAMSPADPVVAPTVDQEIGVADSTRRELYAPPGTAAFLFAPRPGTGLAKTGPSRYLLMITQEVPLWDGVAYSMYQTRNYEVVGSAPGPRIQFNPQVWQFGPHAGDTEEISLCADVVEELGPYALGLRVWDPYELVEHLLVRNKVLSAASDKRGWKSCDLSIVVHAVQRTTFPVFVQGTPAGRRREVSHGRMPLWNVVVNPDDPSGAEKVIFDQTRLEFSVDFTWTNGNNVEILRIQYVAVNFVARVD